MIVFAVGVAWVGYTLALYGYGMVKGYDVSFMQMVSPSNYYTGAWPPCTSPADTIFPKGTCAQGKTKTPTAPFAGKGGPQNVPTSSVALPEGTVAGQHGR